MSGYSGTPLPKKLGIKQRSRVAVSGAPPEFSRLLNPLPDAVSLRSDLRGTADVVLLFVRSRAELAKRWPAAEKAVAEGGRLWIAWPKLRSPLAGDVNEDAVRGHGLARSFVDYKVCAVDETWSGLCFARRSPTA